MESGVFIEFPTRAGMTDREAFAECFALVDAAEALGVNSVWLAEYHFSAISVLSSPITIASAIAARTQRIRIGLAVVLLPLAHPIHIAEDIATLDHISQGRVEFGVGRGTFPDTHDGFNSPFAESRERFDEYLEIVVKAWTQERFSFTGKHYRCDNLWVRPKPLQRPHPPIRVGITSEVTFPLVGRLGFPIIINPPGYSPSPSWRRISSSTARPGTRPATPGLLRWGSGCRSTWPRRPSAPTRSPGRAPWPPCKASVIAWRTAPRVWAPPATGALRPNTSEA